MTWVVIPLKSPLQAKQRLAPLLTSTQRRCLVFTMLSDMLAALRAVERIEHILVVTPLHADGKILESWGIEVLYEREGGAEENGAIEYATKYCLQAGGEEMLVLPGDLPLLTAEAVETLLTWGKDPPVVVLAPSRDGRGTNALFRSPPDVIPPAFGPDSFSRHQHAAHKRGIPCHIHTSTALSLDLDTPEDVACFWQYPHTTHTHRQLQAWHLFSEPQERDE
ncbi:MAG: 2-phospho-L-lactate guanylyltransferase [Nitrospinota bacterium]|nr:MAG: 2-phospho-L-lactate guanylyltransferase [Nitrospinota bacterium]